MENLNFSFEMVQGNFNYPVIKIENKVSGSTGYLMPFRFSYFQVSGSKNGSIDMGSGDHNKEHMKWLVQTSINPKYALAIEVVKCLNSYLSTTYGNVGCNAAFTLQGIPYFTESLIEWKIPLRAAQGEEIFQEFYRVEDIPQFDKFIEESINTVVNYYGIKA